MNEIYKYITHKSLVTYIMYKMVYIQDTETSAILVILCFSTKPLEQDVVNT